MNLDGLKGLDGHLSQSGRSRTMWTVMGQSCDSKVDFKGLRVKILAFWVHLGWFNKILRVRVIIHKSAIFATKRAHPLGSLYFLMVESTGYIKFLLVSDLLNTIVQKIGWSPGFYSGNRDLKLHEFYFIVLYVK